MSKQWNKKEEERVQIKPNNMDQREYASALCKYWVL